MFPYASHVFKSKGGLHANVKLHFSTVTCACHMLSENLACPHIGPLDFLWQVLTLQSYCLINESNSS